MLNLEYEIRLNDENRPYVHLPDDYQDNPEDKFMALELSRYLILNVVQKNKSKLPENEIAALQSCFDTLEILSDEIALLLRQEMENKGEMSINMQRNYHITVDTLKERDNLNYNGIIYNGKIFKRTIGLKVLVMEDMKVYELVNGIDNENWKEA